MTTANTRNWNEIEVIFYDKKKTTWGITKENITRLFWKEPKIQIPKRRKAILELGEGMK